MLPRQEGGNVTDSCVTNVWFNGGISLSKEKRKRFKDSQYLRETFPTGDTGMCAGKRRGGRGEGRGCLIFGAI